MCLIPVQLMIPSRLAGLFPHRNFGMGGRNYHVRFDFGKFSFPHFFSKRNGDLSTVTEQLPLLITSFLFPVLLAPDDFGSGAVIRFDRTSWTKMGPHVDSPLPFPYDVTHIWRNA